MRRFAFLPAFFTVLIATFAFAVAWKVRTYSTTETRITSEKEGSLSLGGAPAASRAGWSAANGVDGAGAPLSGDAQTTATQAATSARISAERDARYRELLNSAPQGVKGAAAVPTNASASHVVTPPKEKPSLIARMVAPIVNAFSGGGAQQRPPNAPNVGQKPAKNDNSSSDTPSKDPKDPNSDVTAPQLMGIEFVPNSIQDGEETLLAITATDDISGVRTISGNIVSPSGALQGFALQREGEASNRFLSKILVPKDAASGAWHINYLNLTDNASNSVTLSWQQGSIPQTGAFTVTSSRSDTTAPTLKAVWLDRPSMKIGEKNSVFVQADDDKSGVNLVSGVFLSPSGFARVGFGCRNQDGTNMWTCDLTPPANADCGDWKLEQVQLNDKANNMTTIRTDNAIVAAVHLNITSDMCDNKPPVVQSITLDTSVVGVPGTVNITVLATDEGSGVASISGQFNYTNQVAPGTQPPRFFFSCRPSGDPSQNLFSGPIAIVDKHQARGTYRLGSLQVIDKANNVRLYSANDPVIANVAFKVQ
ncbi:MAG TPA: hypothetical protein VGR95_00250 [Thermoanaerobaculia bacterium]|nr:hypothetical protein [Thermoanaerobaculia bacterium]